MSKDKNQDEQMNMNNNQNKQRLENSMNNEDKASEQTINSINKTQGRVQIRQLIDIMLLSGVDKKDIEDMLRDLADGVEYYAEDIQWYNNREEQQQ